MKKMIQSDPKQLAARLNQPPTTLLERLEQFQDTMPLSESGKKRLEELRAASASRPKSKTIRPDPKQLAARLSQPPTTLLEMLDQAQVTMPLSGSGKKQLEEPTAGSGHSRRKQRKQL